MQIYPIYSYKLRKFGQYTSYRVSVTLIKIKINSVLIKCFPFIIDYLIKLTTHKEEGYYY